MFLLEFIKFYFGSGVAREKSIILGDRVFDVIPVAIIILEVQKAYRSGWKWLPKKSSSKNKKNILIFEKIAKFILYCYICIHVIKERLMYPEFLFFFLKFKFDYIIYANSWPILWILLTAKHVYCSNFFSLSFAFQKLMQNVTANSELDIEQLWTFWLLFRLWSIFVNPHFVQRPNNIKRQLQLRLQYISFTIYNYNYEYWTLSE